MSFPVPDSKKDQAKDCIERLTNVNNLANQLKESLEILSSVFTEFKQIDGEKFYSKRGMLSKYKQDNLNLFKDLKDEGIFVINILDDFNPKSDSIVNEILESFKNNIDDIEDSLESLGNSLLDFDDLDFQNKILILVENCNTNIIKLVKLVDDRAIKFLEDDVIADKWEDQLSDDIKKDLKTNRNQISEAFKERQNALDGGTMPLINKRPQSLTPADNQKVWNPSDIREMPENEDVGPGRI